VALIGTHIDVYAVLYGIWLCVLVIMKREKLPKIWGIFQTFIATLIPIQYAMAVGLPPALCTGKQQIFLIINDGSRMVYMQLTYVFIMFLVSLFKQDWRLAFYL
jgi:hypothetical protein